MSLSPSIAAPSIAAMTVADWIADHCLAEPAFGDIAGQIGERLRAAGFPVDRAHVTYNTLHPLHQGEGVTWTPEDGVIAESYAHGTSDAAQWTESPIRHAVEHGRDVTRRRLTGPEARLDFPVLKEFAARGFSDYLMLLRPFDSFYKPIHVHGGAAERAPSGVVLSWTTRHESGFSDQQVADLVWLARPVAVLAKILTQRQTAENLVDCYIGRVAGRRVLEGAIRRGDFVSVDAVVWLSDLRDSTEMAASLPRQDYIAALNGFFDRTAGRVEAEGGETLTFIGDGALAIFDVKRLGAEGARAAALRAAASSVREMAAFNVERALDGTGSGAAPLRFGVGLHAGRVDYGNIGVPGRQAWSAIGAAVNETARLESLTKTLAAPVLASRAFIDGGGCEAARWRPLGAHALRGSPAPLEVFAPDLTE